MKIIRIECLRTSRGGIQIMVHFLDSFIQPNSVAIVGASRDPAKMNYQLAENLVRLNFLGKVYLVNPNADEILGKKTYPSVKDIQDEIDLAVLAVPAESTPGALRDIAEKGVERIVIVTGGFSEGGKRGEELQREIKSLAKKRGIRVLGPNTLSPVNCSLDFVISYHRVEECRESGLSLVFQSGFYEPKINHILSRVGVSKIIDLGNKMDINEVDALEYLSEDPNTETIGIHLESIQGDGQRFMRTMKETSSEKPIVILKSGRTPAGSKAAASHTGSIARENNAVLGSLLRQAGVISAQNLDEFWDYTKAFEFLNPPRGNKIAVISMSGGEGVLAMDSCESNGFQIAELEKSTYRKLKTIFPPWEIPLNPFDAGVCMEFHTKELDVFLDVLASIFDDENVDCVVMSLPSPFIQKTSHYLSELGFSKMLNKCIEVFQRMKEKDKPFALWRTSIDDFEDKLVELLEASQIPVYPSPERAIDALGRLMRYWKLQNALQVS